MSRLNWTNDKIISRLQNNKSTKTRWENIKILRTRPSRDLFKKCEELIKSNNYKDKLIGIDILAQLGIPPRPFIQETLKIYFDILKTETNPYIIKSTLYGISHNNDNLTNTQIKKICDFQNTNNYIIKEGLVHALGFIENLESINILIKLTKDKSNYIRNWATFFIGQSEIDNSIIRETLWNRIKDKHQETRFEAICGLAIRNEQNIIKIIKDELLKDDYSSLIFEAILETKNLDFLPILKEQFSKIENDSEINESWKNELKDCIKNLTEIKNDENTLRLGE